MTAGPAPELRLPLADLRHGAIERAWTLDDPGAAWADLPAPLEPLDVRVKATAGERDSIRVEGSIRGAARLECRRCLVEISVPVETRFDLLFSSEDPDEIDADGVWPLDPRAADLELGEALREELWLAVPEFAVCDEACAGLCPRCGEPLSDEHRGCDRPETDPRWEALARLQSAALRPRGAGEPSGG